MRMIIGAALIVATHLAWGQARPALVGEVKRHVVNAVAVDDPSGVAWREPLSVQGANALFLSIEELQLPEKAELVVNVAGKKAASFKAGTQERVVPMIGTSAAVLEIKNAPAGSKIHLIYGLAAALPRGQPFSFRFPPRFEDASALPAGPVQRASDSVAALFWSEGNNWKVCSGFVVSDRHVLTNRHCISQQTQCDQLLVIFGYRTVNGDVSPGTSFSCKKLVPTATLAAADLALLELNVPANFPPPPALKFSPNAPQVGKLLTVIQHPMGNRMQIVREGCDIRQWPVDSPTAQEKIDAAHQCDTAEGSSGSPMVDSSGQVVAVHHWGYGDVGFQDLNRAIGMSPNMRQAIATILNP
jgi:V8-like Glu-specific endopeptidase